MNSKESGKAPTLNEGASTPRHHTSNEEHSSSVDELLNISSSEGSDHGRSQAASPTLSIIVPDTSDSFIMNKSD